MNISNSDISNAITSYGRLNIKRTTQYVIDEVQKLNPEFKLVLSQADTDSMYLSLENVVNYYTRDKNFSRDEIVQFCVDFTDNIIQPLIDKSSAEIAYWFNAYENSLSMDKEIISDVFVSSGKKRYCCRIWDNEGVRLTKPKQKIVGLEIKRSDTPADVRIKLGKIIELLFVGDNNKLIDFIDSYRKEHRTLHIDKIAIPSGISDIDKFYKDPKLTKPMHVKASMLFNELTIHNQEFNPINNGDKIKYVFLKRNPITNADVIGFNDSQFIYSTGLDKFVDYDRLFERTFLNPVKTLTDVINWKIDKNSALMELF